MTAVVPDRAGEWQRLHPLSPLLRGGVVLLAVLGYAASQLYERVLSDIGLGILVPDDGDDPFEGGASGGDGPLEQAVAHPLIALVVVVVFIGLVALVNWVAWRFSRFRVGGGQVELRHGVVFRQHRQVRLERVQAVELSRPLTARALGLARVVVQSAGGSDSTLTLSFLDLARAEELREHLLDLAGRSDEALATGPDGGSARAAEAGGDRLTGPAGPAGPTGPTRPTGPAVGARSVVRPVLEVPNGRLFVATILHGSTLVLGLLAFLAAVGAGVERFGAVGFAGLPVLIPVAFAVGVGRVKELLTHGNFSLGDTGTGVRLQEGLTDLRTTTIPFHRIQALELVQPLWWRTFGWWRIVVNVAGAKDAGDGEGGETTLLPVGTLDEALGILSVVVPLAGAQPWHEAALGDGPTPGWRPASPRARVLDPLSWRRNAWAEGPAGVLLRSGRLTRRAVAVPYARVQSISVRQGWLEARLGLATVHVVTAPGPVSPALAHLDAPEAEAFLDEVAERARVARRRADPVPPSLAPDPPGLVDWVRHPQGTPDTERP